MSTEVSTGGAGRAPGSVGTGSGRWGRPAVRAAVVAAAMAVGSLALYGVAYAVAGVEATEDNWVGFLTVMLMFGAVAVAAVAFVLGVMARARHEIVHRLWLAFAVLPALLAFLVLGELFWWE